MYDAVIIGAGVGGLTCASKLATMGKKVLLLERNHFYGGSSCVFYRKGFIFPMGPLSFSFPEFVQEMLKDVGVRQTIKFKRSHFQLLTPEIDIIYSQNWNKFKNELKKLFPEENLGLDSFFGEFDLVIDSIKEIHKWHPSFLVGNKKQKAEEQLSTYHRNEFELVEKYYKIPARRLLDKYLNSSTLKNLLGSQGSFSPVMNTVHLAFMWNIMSIQGIWFPNCGIHGINEMLKNNILDHGGEIKLDTHVSEIIVKKKRAIGVRTQSGEIFKGKWIISNADYKQVYLKLIEPKHIPEDILKRVQSTPYTGSELCIYLGVDPDKFDLGKMKADHLFYRAKLDKNRGDDAMDDFQNKEIEISLWSNKTKGLAPEKYKSILLRVNMSYEFFKKWRLGYKKRRDGYIEFKEKIVNEVISIVESIIPGLKSSIVEKVAATPLTYDDFLCRFEGSIAGWSRDTKKTSLTSGLLTEQPIKHLLLVGIYSILEPFLGGYPVSMYSGCLAADLIIEKM